MFEIETLTREGEVRSFSFIAKSVENATRVVHQIAEFFTVDGDAREFSVYIDA